MIDSLIHKLSVIFLVGSSEIPMLRIEWVGQIKLDSHPILHTKFRMCNISIQKRHEYYTFCFFEFFLHFFFISFFTSDFEKVANFVWSMWIKCIEAANWGYEKLNSKHVNYWSTCNSSFFYHFWAHANDNNNNCFPLELFGVRSNCAANIFSIV